ncbi:hypothetical protein BCR34DRAFT_602340 [Clohesyomyces aquaticus]|uniref:Uncharacterized protein n=1 Tax=Clohesyomyces aquaticus TaxID=1231657 RepID=A0A1Y1ZIQ5_9PLEO|nr:hypothetical protein BCR34DRAFT_602340 [Clohesyomyces aquaticus]
MAVVSRRLITISASILLLFILAASLATSLQARQPPPKLPQIALAQAAKSGQIELKVKGRINGTSINRVDFTVSSTYFPSETLSRASRSSRPTSTVDEGFIGVTPTPQPSTSEVDEGYIGPIETSQTPVPPKPSPPSPQIPIMALTYAGSGGPKHCRGKLIHKLNIARPASAHRNGSCVSLPGMARCGVFYAGKEDNCEAQLFNMPACLNNSRSYVNTVVFMPEERVVGALWQSMWVRCGIDVPEAGPIDPSILGELLVKPGSKPGG